MSPNLGTLEYQRYDFFLICSLHFSIDRKLPEKHNSRGLGRTLPRLVHRSPPAREHSGQAAGQVLHIPRPTQADTPILGTLHRPQPGGADKRGGGPPSAGGSVSENWQNHGTGSGRAALRVPRFGGAGAEVGPRRRRICGCDPHERKPLGGHTSGRSRRLLSQWGRDTTGL